MENLNKQFETVRKVIVHSLLCTTTEGQDRKIYVKLNKTKNKHTVKISNVYFDGILYTFEDFTNEIKFMLTNVIDIKYKTTKTVYNSKYGLTNWTYKSIFIYFDCKINKVTIKKFTE